MHTSGSKITILFLLTTFISLTSCHKYEDVIPDTCVNLDIDFSDYEFFNLSVAGSSVVVTEFTNNWGACAAGFGGNGIIVYNSGDGYFAYDRTCPYCYKVGGTSVAVKIDGVYAVCPECGTNYALPSYGTPTKAGPGQYMLKNYRTQLSGNWLHVWNPGY
jgi:hypothetical protein